MFVNRKNLVIILIVMIIAMCSLNVVSARDKQFKEYKEVTDVDVAVYWKDYQNCDGCRPGTVRITLQGKVNNIVVNEYQLEFSGSMTEDCWQYRATGLARTYQGETIDYSIFREEEIPEYETVYLAELSVANIHERATQDLILTKIWDDKGHEEFRPKGIQVTLSGKAAGMIVYCEEYSLTGEALSPQWHAVATDLPIYYENELIDYFISGESCEGSYHAVYDGLTVTNSWHNNNHEELLTVYWNDNHYVNRPDSVIVTLSGMDGSGNTVFQQDYRIEGNGQYHPDRWDMLVYHLPVLANDGSYIRYAITAEVVPAGYTATFDGCSVTNSLRLFKTRPNARRISILRQYK